MFKVIVVLLGMAALSFFTAVLSVNETIIQIFFATYLVCAVLAILLSLMKKTNVAIYIAASPIPLGFASFIIWAVALHMINGERHWKEVVRLSTGQEIIVQRSFKSPGLLDGAPIENDIEVNLPHAGHIRWSEHLEPLAIDESKSGDAYLVTIANDYSSQTKYSLPENIYHVAFRYSRSNQWVRVPTEQVPLEIKPNLLISVDELFIKRKYDSNKLVDFSVKQSVDSDPRISSIYRNWRPEQETIQPVHDSNSN